jgi:hypothetical protein
MNSEFGFVHRVQFIFSFICSFVLESTTFGNVCSLSITVLLWSLVIVTSPVILEIAKNIIETAGLLPISVYNNEWIPIATYFETHLPNTERSDEIDSTDGGSDTDTAIAHKKGG